jgi:hypothetical protein
MKLSITNEENWIKEQFDILNEEYSRTPLVFLSKKEVHEWIDVTDLIQILVENFDYSAELSDPIDFSNTEFAKQFNELFQELKNKIVDKFCKETLRLEMPLQEYTGRVSIGIKTLGTPNEFCSPNCPFRHQIERIATKFNCQLFQTPLIKEYEFLKRTNECITLEIY